MTVLPSNNSPLQHSLAKLTEQEIASIDWRVIQHSKDPMICSTAWLPYHAWERSITNIEGWGFAESEIAKRQLIHEYISIHQRKGTPSMIRQLFRDLQLGEIHIIENAANLHWNGEADWQGKHIFSGDQGDWAKYAIIINRHISIAQAQFIIEILTNIAPARCQLLYLDYRQNPILWNNEINFNGDYTFGAMIL